MLGLTKVDARVQHVRIVRAQPNFSDVHRLRRERGGGIGITLVRVQATKRHQQMNRRAWRRSIYQRQRAISDFQRVRGQWGSARRQRERCRGRDPQRRRDGRGHASLCGRLRQQQRFPRLVRPAQRHHELFGSLNRRRRVGAVGGGRHGQRLAPKLDRALGLALRVVDVAEPLQRGDQQGVGAAAVWAQQVDSTLEHRNCRFRLAVLGQCYAQADQKLADLRMVRPERLFAGRDAGAVIGFGFVRPVLRIGGVGQNLQEDTAADISVGTRRVAAL